MFRSLQNRFRRRDDKQSKRARLQRALRVESLERRQLLAADPVPSLVNYLTTEHVDLNIGYSDSDGWSLGPRADVDPTTQFGNEEVVLFVGASALTQRPSGAAYDFVGVDPGQDLYVLPQLQDYDVLYLGFSAYDVQGPALDQYDASGESKGRTGAIEQRWLKASLVDVNHWTPDGSEGTGEISVWQSGVGSPRPFISSYDDGIANPNSDGFDATDGISADDAIWIVDGGHLHYSFGFTQPGRYEVDMRVSGYFDDGSSATPGVGGYSESSPVRLYFSVDSAGELEFESSTYSVDEGAGTASIDVVRVGGSDGRVEVNYATSDGTATAGSDYTPASGSLVFEDGETRKTVTIPILEDELVEGNETVNLSLSVTPFDFTDPAPDYKLLNDYVKYEHLPSLADPNGLLGANDTAVLTILDNDVPPTISDVTNQTTAEDTPTGAIAFTVGDNATPVESLVVTAVSSNPTLVPNGNIVLGGSGAERTVTLTPTANLFGVTTITLTVTDGDGLTATDSFDLTVPSVNDLPTIADIADQSIDQDTATGAIPFTVGDVETASSALSVTGTSSNTTLVPNENIVLGGSGANRTVTVTPAATQTGSATITLTVTDADGGTTTDTFIVNVDSTNQTPTISNISDQATDEDTPTNAIAFTVGDLETSAAALSVSASSSNQTLVPDGNIVIEGSGADRTVTLTPAENQSGTATISLTVTDAGGMTATETFVLSVGSVNDPPTISPIDDVVMDEDGTVTISFTIADAETATTSLTVSGSRTNATLFPSISTSSSARLHIQGTGTTERSLRIRPAADQSGTSDVTLTVIDTDGGSSSQTFSITVNPVHDAPDLLPDNFVAIPDTTSTFDLFHNDRAGAEPGQTFVLDAFTQPSHGSLVAGSVPGTVRYTPDSGYLGADQFTYAVLDNTGATVTQTSYVTVEPYKVVDGVHTDIRFDFENGQWSNAVHADLPYGTPVVTHSTVLDYDEALLVANDGSRLTIPATSSAAFNFTGVAPGEDIWMLPQSQIPGVLWPGFSTEDIPSGTFAEYTPIGDARAPNGGEWIRVELVGVDGPDGGEVALFSTDSFGTPEVWWDSVDGFGDGDESAIGDNASDTFWIVPGTHAHMNWSFSQPGRYALDVQMRAFVDEGGTPVEVVSPINTLHFDVGALTGLPIAERAPIPQDDTGIELDGSGPFTLNVLANDTSLPDPHEALAITSVTQPTHGTVVILPGATQVQYTPNFGYGGSDSFTYTITDEHGGSATATATVEVTAPPNTAPTISEISNQFVLENGSTDAIALTIGDAETAAEALVVTATSSNPSIVPNENIVLGGSGAHRTLSITPAADQVGSATITVTVTDGGGLMETETFDLVVGAGFVEFESASSLVDEQSAWRTVTVHRVGDSEDSLVVHYETMDGTATASTTDYVATSGTLVFGPGETSKVITVQLGNDSLSEANETFSLLLTGAPGTVGPQATHVFTINDTPAITRVLESGFVSTGIPSQSTVMGTPTEPVFFTVSDAETAAADLIVSAVSNNPSLLPDSGILLEGSGAERSITLSPLPDVTGTARVYVTLTDGNGASITRNFAVYVGASSSENAIAMPDVVPDVVLTADESFTLNYTVADPTWVTTVSRSNTTLFNTPGTGSSSDLRTRPSSGGTERTLRIRPTDQSTSVGRYGTSTVTLGFTGTGAPEPQTFNVRVNPRAVADNNLLAIPGTTSTFDVLANDVAPLDGHSFTITGTSDPANGTLEIGDDGKLHYTPTNLAADGDQFTYTVTISSSDEFDGFSFTGTAYVKIGGYVVVDSPTASQHVDMDFDYIDGEWIQRIRTSDNVGKSIQSGTYSETIIDSDEGVLFIDSSTKLARPEDALYDVLGVPAGTDVWYGPTSGSGDKLFLGFATESTSGIDSYTPVGDARVSGDQEWMAIQLVGFSGPGHATVFYGGDVAFDTFDGLNSADDAVSGGNVSDTYWTRSNGHSHPAWFFTAAGQYDLTFQTTVRVDGQFVTSPATTFRVAVDTISGDARLTENVPLLRDDTATLPAGSVEFAIDVLANDSSNPDGYESLRIVATGAASHGTVGIAADGLSLTYTPDSGFDGNASFTYTVRDEHGGLATASVDVTVEHVNTAPTIAGIEDQFVLKNGSTGAIQLTIGDAETAAEALVVTATSSDTSIVPNDNLVLGGIGAHRTLTITPAADQIGSAIITVTVTDGAGVQTSATFDIHVTADALVPFDLPIELDALGNNVSVVTADFNGDGNVDIAQKITTEEIFMYLGNGDGTFQSSVLINPDDPYFRGSNYIFAVDADGDGDIDILTVQGESSGYSSLDSIVLYVNDGNANFTLRAVDNGLASSTQSNSAQPVEFNGDGQMDVVLVDSSTSLAYYQSQPDGSYSKTMINGTFTSLSYNALAPTDIDGDGDIDLVVYEGSSTRRLSVLTNDGAGNFTSTQELTFDSRTTVQAVTDITGDGLPDILTTQSSTTWYYAQNADGSFGPRTELFDSSISYVTPTDMNQDGVTDLVFYQSGLRWAAGQGNGMFGDPLLIESGFVFGLTTDDFDNDGDQDVASIPLSSPLRVLENLSGENPMQLIPPVSRHYLVGDEIEMQVHFGFPIDVTGTPRIALQMGENVVYADYVSGSGGPTLLFRHTVGGTDLDLDGVQLVDNTIDLNGGTLTDPIGGPAVLQFPGTLSGVTVNAPGPHVEMISRLDTNPTTAGTARFAVQFSEDVTGVDDSDFMVVMNAGDLSGATIDSVTGSGSLYEVTVTTGSGSGALGLSVPGNGTIVNGGDFALALPYVGGEVYTLRRGTADPIDHYYVENHADYRPVWDDGEFTVVLHGSTSTIPGGEVRSDEIYAYADSNTLVERPENADYDFTGVGSGEAFYVLPSSNTASVPFLGFSGESIPSDLFASYLPDDARITSSTPRPYMKYQMVDLRTDTGGDFSIWSISGGNPRVWMASSDGFDDTDNIWLRSGSHAHMNVGFSKAGVYEVDVVVSAFLDTNANGVYDEGLDAYYESGVETMVFAVDTLGAVDDSFTVVEGETLNGDVSVNDDWHAAMGDYTASVETEPANGTLSLNADGSFSYQPNEGFAGQDSFDYRLTNERGGFTTATVSIGVFANRLVPFALPEYHGGAYATGTWGQATGDFNGDGNVDLIVSGTQENSLTFMHGNGDGTFQSEQLLNAGAGVWSEGLATVDYDNDGDTDLLVYEYNAATLMATADEGTITLYRNDGSANFTREVLLDGLTQGYWIDAGDVNGDGLADVVYGASRYVFATRSYQIEKAVVLQQADGTLGDKTVLTDEYHGEVIMEDVDGDGHQDIVSTGSVFDSSTFTSTAYLQVFRGNGDGSFETPLNANSPGGPDVQQVVDLNGDDRKDLLVYDRGSSSHLGYYPQQADGSFGERVDLLPGSLYSQHALATDMNGDNVPDIVSYSHISGSYQVSWAPGLGDGTFGDPIMVSSEVGNGGLHVADLDNDSYPDIINAGSTTADRVGPVSVFLNKTGEDPMVLLPPAARLRIGGDPIEFQVYFGFPIDVTGTPRVALQVGENIVYAEYVSGSGTPLLDFRYIVSETDIDLDGVQLASNSIDLNGGTLTDPIGGEAVLEFPNTAFEGVIVNAVGPLVSGITRLDSTPTDVDSVRFEVEFAEDVLGVDAGDFELVMNAGDLAGATIDSVSGSGTTYVITVLTGSGNGTLALSVRDAASITDSDGHPLARGYFGGEVYTLRRGAPDPIEYYYTDQHADYRPVWNDGEMTLAIHGGSDVIPGGEIASNAIYTYADSNAIVERAEDPAYDFTGVDAGEPIYVLPSSQVSGVPYLGFTGSSVPRDLFASYVPEDPRITSSTARPYLRMEMTDMRSSTGGDFSLWSSPSSGPRVYMTTSDGISSEDTLWLYAGSHLHRTIAFSKPGTYEVDVFVSGYLDTNANGVYDEGLDAYYESGIQTMVFNVDTLGAVDDEFQVGPGTFNGDVSANDAWHQGLGDYVISVEEQPTHGTLQLQADGTFNYEPSSSFDGNDHFVYRLTNARGGYTTATVTLSSNHSPVANDDSYTVSEDEALNVAGPGVLGNDTDADGDALKAAVVSGPQNGSLSLNPDGSFSYVPNPDFHGTDSFTYTTTDMRYEVTPLGTLGGNSSYALDVNNLNQVSGNSGIVEGSSNPLHAFSWTDGTMEDLGVVAGTGSNNFSRGYAINDAGVVVGESDNSTPKAFRWENGVIANLGTLGGSSAVANDINNAGEIVGSSSNGTATKPFIYVDGAMLELPTIAGNAASSGRAWGISPDGRFIVGVTRADDAEYLSHATLWERQEDESYAVVDMGALLDEHHYSQAYAVNDSGNAVGASVVGTVSPTSSTSLYHGFVYHDGQMIDVGTLDYLSYAHSELKDINATDQFVGYVAGFYNYPTFGGAALLGELVGNETAIIDLNELIDNEDWTLLIGEGINNGRSIVGYGKLNGVTQAYLLTPVSPDNDNNVFGNVATVTIEVTPVADDPIAEDDAFVVTEGNSLYGNVLFNDSDPDADPLTVQLDAAAASGDVTLSADGAFVYTPSEAFDGADSFTYIINDGTGRTATATVVISEAAETAFDIVLSEGHTDIGVLYGVHDHDEAEEDEHGHDHDHGAESPEWDLHVHDHEDGHEYHPDDVLLYVGMDAINNRPAGPEYEFIGTDAGDPVFILPATENPDLLFLGLGTEEIESGTFLDGSLTLRLKSAIGPGHFSLWTSGPHGPNVAMATSDGITEADLMTLLEGGHAHANFGFTEMGMYQLTFQATGTRADGQVVASEDVTYHFQVGNTVEGIEVQNGMTQRSYIRDLDVLFASDDGLDAILADPDRVQIMKYDLNGENGSLLDGTEFGLSTSGNSLNFDFGQQGLGGNRNSNAGDGFYQVGIDADGDGVFETVRSFYRLLGDLNGDGTVDMADRMAVMYSLRNQNPDSDVNGDGVINSADLALVSRAVGKKLKDGLLTDDDDNN